MISLLSVVALAASAPDLEMVVQSSHVANINTVAVSPDGKLYATGSDDHTVAIYTASDDRVLRFLRHDGPVRRVVFSPDGAMLATAQEGMGRSLRLWDPKTGKTLRDLATPGDYAQDCAFDASGRTLVAALSGGEVIGYDVASGARLALASGHQPGRVSVAVGPTGLVASAGGDNVVLVRALPDLKRTVLRWRAPVSKVVRLRFSPDGKYLGVAGHEDYGTLRFLEVASGREVNADMYCGLDGELLDFAFSPNGRFVAVTSERRGFLLFNWEGEIRAPAGCRSISDLSSSMYNVYGIEFFPDSRTIIGAGGEVAGLQFGADYDVRFYSVPRGERLRDRPPRIQKVTAAAISSDGRALAVGSSFGMVDVWDLEELRRVTSLYVEFNPVVLLSFSEDDRRLSATIESGDGRVWDTSSYKLLETKPGGARVSTETARAARHGEYPVLPARADLRGAKYPIVGTITTSGDAVELWNRASDRDRISFTTSRDDWIVYGADGYFDASAGGGSLVLMTRGLQSYGVDQFAARNNRPDILLTRLWRRAVPAAKVFEQQWQRRLKRAGLSPGRLALAEDVPEVVIEEASVEGSTVELEASVRAKKHELASYNIYVNDVPLYSRGKPLSGRDATISEELALLPGENKLELSASNVLGEESPRVLTRAHAPTGGRRGSLWLLAFGVSTYADPALNLRYASKDARDLAKLFESMRGGTGGFDAVHAKVLADAEVTPAGIRDAKRFLEGAKVEDTFVLFIAGHGTHDRDAGATYYYLTHNARLDDLPGTAVRFEEIEALLYDIAPRKKLFLMDTCESGEADDDGGLLAGAGKVELRSRGLRSNKAEKRPTPSIRAASRERYIFNDLLRRSGAVVYSSSRGNELSYERDDLANGLFTEAVLRAFGDPKADRNEDGVLDTQELRGFVTPLVAELSQGLQNPVVDRDNLVARHTFPALRAENIGAPPEPTGSAKRGGGKAGPGFRLGQRVTITEAGHSYPDLHQGTCFDWPTPDIKKVAGELGWGGRKPANGDTGEVVGAGPLGCNSKDPIVVLKLDNGLFVAIKEDGVAALEAGAAPK